MLQAHFVYLLSQTWGQPFICKALIPFSGKWTESKHSTQFATGLVTAVTCMICQSSAESRYLHSLPPLPFFVSLGSCPYSLLLWACGFVWIIFSLCVSFWIVSIAVLLSLLISFCSAWSAIYPIHGIFHLSLAAFHLRSSIWVSLFLPVLLKYNLIIITHTVISLLRLYYHRDVKSWVCSPHCTFHTHDSLILQLEVCS